MVKMARRKSPSKSSGLGMGLDALIKSKTREEPEKETGNFESDKDEEDILNNNSDRTKDADTYSSKTKSVKKSSKRKKSNSTKSTKSSSSSSNKKTNESAEDLSTEIYSESKESGNRKPISADAERINMVTSDVRKNPRITLWSSRSAAVLRYLKKTQPEFSISKEASKLIEDAVKEKYPEIWDLFDEL
jgi:hypothetical protein